jgi:hypothetical protein
MALKRTKRHFPRDDWEEDELPPGAGKRNKRPDRPERRRCAPSIEEQEAEWEYALFRQDCAPADEDFIEAIAYLQFGWKHLPNSDRYQRHAWENLIRVAITS